MTPAEEIERITQDSHLSVSEKSARLADVLMQQDAQGVSTAVECLMTTTDVNVSEFVASHLGMLPGAHEGKTRAAERLRTTGQLAQSAAKLVPWIPGSLMDAFIQDYLAAPNPESPLVSVLLAIGVSCPDHLRPYADQVENPFIKRSLLSGAPNTVADALFDQWQREENLECLHSLALVRTQHAIGLIESARDEVDDGDDWDWLMPLAGRLPDTSKNAGFPPSFMGFIGDKGASAHAMGGTYDGDVPLCAECGTPGERILTLSAGEMPQRLSRDPSFFWFSCSCEESDRIVVRITEKGTKVYFGPQGPAKQESRVVPGERSLVLEPHPNQTGVSLMAIPGRSQHQIGGLPRWPSPELHPICPECGNFMPFLAAIDSGPTPFGPMGFEGSLFGFWCDDCAVSTTQIQE